MRRGKENGFTLVEAVIALLVISLALAAVLQLARLSASDQRRTVAQVIQAKDHHMVLEGVESALLPVEPLYVDQFTATSDRLNCLPDAPVSCALSPPEGYQFRYVVGGIEYTEWPLRAATQETRDYASSERLNALIVLDKEGRLAGAIELRVDHPPDCQFDMISRICRRPENGEAQASVSLGERP